MSQRGPMTEKQKKMLGVALVIHVIVLNVTWRDLKRRPPAGVRGNKNLWRLASLLNTSGSLSYWLFGRRRVHELVLAETEG